ncbi:hypothetical protein AMTRI_Chr09g16280 [Amborella trichopoda]
MLFFLEFYLNLGCHMIHILKKSMETAKYTHAKVLKHGFGCNLCTGIAFSSVHYKVGNLLSAHSMIYLKSHRGEIFYKVILNGYLYGRRIRSDSRLFPPTLVHGSRASCFEYH